jgi:hypothetical protein
LLERLSRISIFINASWFRLSAKYVAANMKGRAIKDGTKFWALRSIATVPGSIWSLSCRRRIDQLHRVALREIVHGFDSFQGLPKIGVLGREPAKPVGWVPKVGENVQLHVGWFEESLPKFLSGQSGEVALLHIDCDLYSSTKTVLSALSDRIQRGTVIVFDEYFSYIGWENHEHAAFMEFAEGRDFDYIFYSAVGSPAQVAVMMK